MRLLARREHAARELQGKLEARGFDSTAVAAEIQRLARDGLQSDDRFADLFVEQRVARGDGPLKLRAALTERGVDDARIEHALASYADDWPALAASVLARRFGSGGDRARRARFLQQRGFPDGVIQRVVAGPAGEQERTEPEG